VQFAIAVHTEAVVTTVPVSAGNVMVFVPAVAGPAIDSVPEVDPGSLSTLPAPSDRSLLTVVVPVAAPMVSVVAAPNALMVVAVALNTENDALFVVTLVVNCGLVLNTRLLLPVSSVKAAAKLALDGVAKNVATPVARPDTPVLIGRPVQLVSVPLVGVPRSGVTSVGLVANTNEPEPVSSVTALMRFAELGVARNVATPVARPDTPELIGRPVQLVSVPLAGVPSVGAENAAFADEYH